jgi:hypothetical protein
MEEREARAGMEERAGAGTGEREELGEREEAGATVGAVVQAVRPFVATESLRRERRAMTVSRRLRATRIARLPLAETASSTLPRARLVTTATI